MQLRRGYGRVWCPAGAHWVGEGQVSDYDPMTHERRQLKTCRQCQLSSGKLNRKARAVSAAGRA
ncbi:hypothetical protein KZO79_08815 [Chromohalobacter sp. TMW 2.2271]|uniref:hypothetical protein n=1 Tax=Chromohalobacter sp. TMW 2.2271 TaxID=2860330 RepID=UPI0021BF45C5|nr:hypothetical protein [Chromohalobacter sp. TMW 2.2271]MCT8514943.1 hypothetical protein [Chromohalobacter sp. TMW 2.2271]